MDPSNHKGMKADGRGLSPTLFSDIDLVFGNTDMIVRCVCLSNSGFAVMDKTYHFQLDVKVHSKKKKSSHLYCKSG